MKVYFNNSCSICRAEINLYKKENISELNWIGNRCSLIENIFKLPIVYHFFYIGYEIVAFFLYLKNRKQLKN